MKSFAFLLAFSTILIGCKKQETLMSTEIEDFKIIGIAIQTTNEKGQAEKDLGKLWGRFYGEDISAVIPNKDSEEVYSLFTDYESDYTGAYTAIIGHKVHSLDSVPQGFTGREFKGGKYVPFKAQGPMPQAIVDSWKDIWSRDEELKRRYTVDFEVYGPKSQQGDQSEVDIYIAVK
jgi:predicted transcriptional regulator YdeE